MPRKKAPGTAADYRNGEKFALVPANGEPRCDFPAAIEENAHPAVVRAFDRYWTDPVAAILQESDLTLVERYFACLNRFFTLSEEADHEPVVPNSTGTMSINPKYSAANMALQAAERVEKQLGIGPANRARLGIDLVAYGEATQRGFERGESSQSGALRLRPRSDPRDEDE